MDQRSVSDRDWYIDLGVTFTFINYIIEECKTASFVVDRSYNRRASYDSNLKMRSLVSSALRGANIWDIGIMEWPAGVNFEWHKDYHPTRGLRGNTINIMLNPPTENNYCEFCDINPLIEEYNPSIHKRIVVPYRQNVLTLLNTTEWHNVVNTSPISRYLFTIGFNYEDRNYSVLKSKFEKNELFSPSLVVSI